MSSNSVAVAAVTDEPLSVVLQSISAAAAQVTTISSRMEQEKHLKAFNEVLKASGQFVFKQPDCWRWELTEPVASGLSVCGDHGQRWHEKGAIVQSFKLDNEPWLKHFATQVTAWTTADFDLLQKYYIITLLEQNPPTLKLVPKESAARRLISALEITFSGDYSYVVEIIIHESDRDYTAIKFLDVVVNDPLVKDYFE
ncbi:outer membrane lipoprotein carrier protein LolA [bacterium]|nr:outer membrane lipoprotein carrier protein LolA [bacterium]